MKLINKQKIGGYKATYINYQEQNCYDFPQRLEKRPQI